MKDNADDAVVVVLDLSEQMFAGIENEGFTRLDHGRALVAYVSRRGVLESGFLDGGGTEKLTEAVQANLFGDVELEQDVDRTGEDKGLWRGLDWVRHPVKDSTASIRKEY